MPPTPWFGVEPYLRWWIFKYLVVAVMVYFAYSFWKSPMRNKTAGAEKSVS